MATLSAAHQGALSAQQGNVRSVRAAAQTIVAADLMRDIAYIASDELRGRATPSPGLDSAAAYVVRALTQLGVKPAGDNGTYLQHYTVLRAPLDTTQTTGTLGAQPLKWGDEFLVTSFCVAGSAER